MAAEALQGLGAPEELPAEAVLLLKNVQRAGPLLTSSEPDRIGRGLAVHLSLVVKVPTIIECDRPRTAGLSPRVIALDEAERRPRAAIPEDAEMLVALAAAQTRRVPLAVWDVLAAAMDSSHDGTGSADAVATFEEHLRVTRDDNGALINVSFRDDALRRSLNVESATGRRSFSRAHARITEELLRRVSGLSVGSSWASAGDAGAYASEALPVHAALGGVLPQLLDNADFLVSVSPYALRQGLALAYPDGVPQGTFVSALHYMESEGVITDDQGEWAAWLHHAAVTLGRTRLAEEIVANGVNMPWRTLWSRWRPPGQFGTVLGQPGPVDEITAVTSDARPALVTRRDVYDELVDDELDCEGIYEEFLFTLDDGSALYGPQRVEIPSGALENQQVPGHSYEVLSTDVSQAAAPRMPNSVWAGTAPAEGLLALGGRGGVFVIEVLDDRLPPDPTAAWGESPLAGPHTRAATWALPTSVPLSGQPDRGWLEESFGPGICRPVPDQALPQGLAHDLTRRLLSETGLPCLGGFFGLELVVADRQGFERRDCPPEISDTVDGPCFLVGSWMGAELLVAGHSGHVIVGPAQRRPSQIAASHLGRFLTCVRLYHEYRVTTFSCPAETDDVRRSLLAWWSTIDPSIEGVPHYKTLAEGSRFRLGEEVLRQFPPPS
ncbi:SUKH-4 family immunity protein [Streptomyces sp. NPDC004647]|uniref:SUKH-4 family immunity protein n=1 Tax=Streptomyces sp. NPDC004647 TaxID=3154671 RepID=UPI0033A6132C